MNVLITCPGRAVTMIKTLKTEFSQAGYGTIVTAPLNIEPALYAADRAYLVPPLKDPDYIPRLLEICRQEKVKAVLTLTDEDILNLSPAAQEFRNMGVLPVLAEPGMAQLCYDRLNMYGFMTGQDFPCPRTYPALEDFLADYERQQIDFPVTVKPRTGFGSSGAMRCKNLDELKLYLVTTPGLIIQEYLEGPEYGLDLYMDMVSREMVSVFAKQKLIKMGSTATGVSVKDEAMFGLAERLAKSLGATGPVNIEITRVNAHNYISGVTPRFGDSYIFAQACGVGFGKLIINNINGLENIAVIGNYEIGRVMMKYDYMFIKAKPDLLA